MRIIKEDPLYGFPTVNKDDLAKGKTFFGKELVSFQQVGKQFGYVSLKDVRYEYVVLQFTDGTETHAVALI